MTKRSERVIGVWRKAVSGLVWLGRHEMPALLVLAAGGAVMWCFLELADEVTEGETESFDERIILALRDVDPATGHIITDDPWGPLWLQGVMHDITAFGSMTGLTLISLAVAGYLLLQRKWRATLVLTLAVGAGMGLSFLLKFFYDRPRPDLVEAQTHFFTSSFPSGHSMMAAITYLTLGALLARNQQTSRLKAFPMLVALIMVFLVGFSRVYLGVHWPTDVVAGWTAGAAWAAICWLIDRLLQRAGYLGDA